MARKNRTPPFKYYKSPSSEREILRCDIEGCTERGTFKASDPHTEEGRLKFLCEEHIRIHNESVDFYKDMTPEQIEYYLREDMKWRSPTWPMSIRHKHFSHVYKNFIFKGESKEDSKVKLEMPSHLQNAIEILQVSWPLTKDELKSAYKSMVKKYHPDINRHLEAGEEKIKAINIAYQIINKFLSSL